MKAFSALLFALIFSSLTPSLYAQDADYNEGIRKNPPALVSVPVSVSDREGHYISGLEKKDFTVFQDGVKQDIKLFKTEEEPLNVALLIDTSRSTKDVLKTIKGAAKNFIKLLNPADKCLIASFDSQVSILAGFTSDQDGLVKALDQAKVSTEAGTVMRRAVQQITTKSFERVTGRKAIIILTDGKDFGSYITKGELMNLLEESDVMIYSVFYKTGVDLNKLARDAAKAKDEKISKKAKKKYLGKKYGVSLDIPDSEFPTREEIAAREKKDDLEAIDALEKMADNTAGRFYLKDVTDLKKTFEQIGDELRQQYRIGFYPKQNSQDASPATPSDGVHNIKVKVDRPDVVVRERGSFRAKQLQPAETKKTQQL